MELDFEPSYPETRVLVALDLSGVPAYCAIRVQMGSDVTLPPASFTR